MITRNEQDKLDSHAWPGGYPLFYMDLNQDILCPECANKEEPANIIAFDANWEDSSLYCEGCSRRIPSAYADEDLDHIGYTE